jgi:hypothetical protein
MGGAFAHQHATGSAEAGARRCLPGGTGEPPVGEYERHVAGAGRGAAWG